MSSPMSGFKIFTEFHYARGGNIASIRNFTKAGTSVRNVLYVRIRSLLFNMSDLAIQYSKIADRKQGGTGSHHTFYLYASWYMATDPDCFKLVLDQLKLVIFHYSMTTDPDGCKLVIIIRCNQSFSIITQPTGIQVVQVFTTHILFLCIMVHGNGYGLLYIGIIIS